MSKEIPEASFGVKLFEVESFAVDVRPPEGRADAVDRIIEQWRAQRGDLNLRAMAVFGRLGRLAAIATARISGRLGDFGLAIGEFDVLASLRRAGAPHALPPSTMARMMMLSPAAMTNRLDRLEGRGLLTRVPNPDDRRSVLVRLTAAGRDLVDRAVAAHVANERDLLAALDDDELAIFDDLLRRLLADLEDPT